MTVVRDDEMEVTVTPEEQLMASSSPIPCVGARVGGAGGVREGATVGGAGDSGDRDPEGPRLALGASLNDEKH